MLAVGIQTFLSVASVDDLVSLYWSLAGQLRVALGGEDRDAVQSWAGRLLSSLSF